jgi:hypothetical protein
LLSSSVFLNSFSGYLTLDFAAFLPSVVVASAAIDAMDSVLLWGRKESEGGQSAAAPAVLCLQRGTPKAPGGCAGCRFRLLIGLISKRVWDLRGIQP